MKPLLLVLASVLLAGCGESKTVWTQVPMTADDQKRYEMKVITLPVLEVEKHPALRKALAEYLVRKSTVSIMSSGRRGEFRQWRYLEFTDADGDTWTAVKSLEQTKTNGGDSK